jgi:hypothetical protein
MTSAAVSSLRVHHDADEIRQAIGLDRLRQMAKYPRGYSVSCDCQRDGIAPELCEGLTMLNHRGSPVARFTGRQYVAAQTLDGGVAIFSRLIH